MIDGVLPAVAQGVFGTLRNELWTLQGVSWIVTGKSAMGPLHREPPADAFFARTVMLAPLSDADARKLLHVNAPTSTRRTWRRRSRQVVATRAGC